MVVFFPPRDSLLPPSQCKQVPTMVSLKKGRRLKIDYLISPLPLLGGVSAAFHLLSAILFHRGSQAAIHLSFLICKIRLAFLSLD